MRLIVTENLEQQAFTNERLRQCLNIHDSYDSPIQIMINFLTSHTFIEPHDHSIDNNTEYLFLLDGEISIVFFNHAGEITKVEHLVEKSQNVGIEINSKDVHTVVCHSNTARILEVKQGPFIPQKAKKIFNFPKFNHIENLKSQIEKLKY